MAVYDEGFAPSAGNPRVTNLVNYAGAALSLALILGVGLWGYKLIMRDVTGIPVVRAMEGEMRVLPDNPGGDVALHTGLAVNEVAALGEAGGPEDRLVLAPRTAGLTLEDLEAQPLAELSELPVDAVAQEAPALVNADPQAALNTDEILALVDQITAEETPLAPAAQTQAIAASVPGVAVSIRPAIRPGNLRLAVPAVPVAAVAAAAAAAAATPATSEVAITTATFPVGTNLVQLGAFQSPALAAEEWDRLLARFGELMANRERVIQVSNQSSATWYRLRASGFADRDEARRLCAALQAEGAECIAVVVN